MTTASVLSASLSLIRQKAASCAAGKGGYVVLCRFLSDRVTITSSTYGRILPAQGVSPPQRPAAGHPEPPSNPDPA